MSENSIDRMLQEVKEQSDLLTGGSQEILAQVRSILAGLSTSQFNKIYISGCGDSYYAGICTQEIYKKYAGVPTHVYQAIEFSRYEIDYVDNQSILLAVSNSGEVARTIETVTRAKAKGAMTFAVTSNRESRLAKAADEVIEIKIPPVVGLVPGTRSFVGSKLALTCFAFEFGASRSFISETEKLQALNYLEMVSKAMADTFEANFDLVGKYVDHFFTEAAAKVDIYHVLGSGPNAGTANFGTMKLVEAAAFESIPQGIEEWAHTQYFVTHGKTHVIIIANRGASHDRALEVMQAVKVVDGKVIAIAEEDDAKVKEHAHFVWPITGLKDIPEEFSPFIYAIPLEILSIHLAKKFSQNAMDFAKKPWKKQENFRQIFGSVIR